MHYLLSVEQMRKADSTAIDNKLIPSIVLMENAARSTAEIIKEKVDVIGNFLIFCGSGNNGGDGFALARHLIDVSNVQVYWIGSEDKMSPETRTNFQALKNLDVDIIHLSDSSMLDKIIIEPEDTLIDSLLGVGGSENIRGIAKDILKYLSENDNLKIAVDAPTGLNTDTGATDNLCFEADLTITMFAPKIGMFLQEAPDVCGDIYIADLGAPKSIIKGISDTYVIEFDDLEELLPLRTRNSTKFDHGRILIISGSEKFPGAASLCSNSAMCSGVGLVFLASCQFHASILPEVIPIKLDSNSDNSISSSSFELIKEELEKADSIVIGPGLSDSNDTTEFVSKVLSHIRNDQKVILDADSLLALQENSILSENIILTPHSGEFARLTKENRADIEKDPINKAKYWAKKLNCNILLKTSPVVITNGSETFLNIHGNPGMGTAGSGDVLSGLIGSFAGQGLDVLTSAAVSSFLHARAGDIFLAENDVYTLTASKLIEYLPKAINE